MAAAAAGGECGGRGLRLARGALSREARKRGGRTGAPGGHLVPPARRLPHHGQRRGRSQRKAAVEREKGGTVGARSQGLAPLPRRPAAPTLAVTGPPCRAGTGAGAGSWAGRAPRPSPRPGQRPRQGSGSRPGACLLLFAPAPRPVTAAARGDRGRGRGGRDCWRIRVAHSCPVLPGEGAGSPRAFRRRRATVLGASLSGVRRTALLYSSSE